MLFSVRLVSRQPQGMTAEAWQAIVGAQLQATRSHYEQGRIKAIYRETGLGVLAIYDVPDARELDQLLAQLPMAPYFAESTVHALWDLGPVLQSMQA